VVAFGKQFPGGKGSMRRCDCHDTIASSFVANVWDEVFTHFHAIAVEHRFPTFSGLPPPFRKKKLLIAPFSEKKKHTGSRS
jgi:hypothetical protein